MGGNAIRCVAKYLYDNGIVPRDDLTIEAGGTVHRLHLYTRFGTVGLVTVDMGKPAFEPANVPVMLEGEGVIDRRGVPHHVPLDGQPPLRRLCRPRG